MATARPTSGSSATTSEQRGFLIRFSPDYVAVDERTFVWGLNSDKKFFGDLNNDGQCDIVLARFGYSYFGTYSPDWSGTDFSYGFGIPGDRPGVADFDGDGLMDLVAAREGGGSIHWYVRTSSSIWTDSNSLGTFGSAGDAIVLDDYNGDGLADLAVFRDGEFRISYSPDYDGTDRAEALGDSGDVPLQRPTEGEGIVGW